VSPVIATTLAGASDLTYGVLKQFAIDQLDDRTDDKGIRRAGRIVNQAVLHVAGERNWAWHLRRFRVTLRPRLRYSAGVSMSAMSHTVRKVAGSWPSDIAGYTLYFSGRTDLLRIRTRASSTQLTTFSNEVLVASAAITAGTGIFVKNRYQLDVNFKAVAEDIHQKDFFGPAAQFTRGEMMDLMQTQTPSEGSPVGYMLELNPYTARWELVIWQWPSELSSMDLWTYNWPGSLSNDSDVLDWDQNHSEVIYDQINVKCLQELRKWADMPAAMAAYRASFKAASDSDSKYLAQRVAGDRPVRIKRMALNRPFTDGS